MSQPQARALLMQADGKEREYAVTSAGLTLGRDESNDVVLPDPKVSRAHARIERGDQGYLIVDLGSAWGTWLNGSKVQRAALASGDVIRLGDSAIRFQGTAPLDDRRSEPEVDYAELGATALEPSPPSVLTSPITANLTVRTSQRTWEVPLTQEALTIGRSPDCDLVLDDPGVSRRHARIERLRDSFVLQDLKSTNGTWLGLRRIEEYYLHDGDTVRVGGVRLAFKRNLSPEELSLFEGLRAPVEPPSLDVEIDRAEAQKQVDEIVESDFFKGLKAKARRMRGS